MDKFVPSTGRVAEDQQGIWRCPAGPGLAVAFAYGRRLSIQPVLFDGQCSPSRFHSLVPLPRWLIGGTFREVGAVLRILPVYYRLLHGRLRPTPLSRLSGYSRSGRSVCPVSDKIGTEFEGWRWEMCRADPYRQNVVPQTATAPVTPLRIWGCFFGTPPRAGQRADLTATPKSHPKLLDRQSRNIPWLADASLPDLDYLLGDHRRSPWIVEVARKFDRSALCSMARRGARRLCVRAI
jgi:hypothetical protein